MPGTFNNENEELREIDEFLRLIKEDMLKMYDLEGTRVEPTGSVSAPFELIFNWQEGTELVLTAMVRPETKPA